MQATAKKILTPIAEFFFLAFAKTVYAVQGKKLPPTEKERARAAAKQNH